MTKPIREATKDGIRTKLNMQVSSEFYAAPQRYILGANESAFVDANGNPKPQWSFMQDKVLAIESEKDSEGNPTGTPSVGQFPQMSPTPYIQILENLAKEVAMAANLPVNYFLENTNAPTSADAIRANEAPLVKHAERKQSEFSKAWNEVGRLALLVRDGKVPSDYSSVSPKWRSAATPTKAASTDAAIKLISSNVIPADSDVVLDMVDMSESDKARVREERKAAKPEAPVAVPDEQQSPLTEPNQTV
jgi:hypothetical protein